MCHEHAAVLTAATPASRSGPATQRACREFSNELTTKKNLSMLASSGISHPPDPNKTTRILNDYRNDI